MRYAVLIGSLLVGLLLVAACGGVESPSTPTDRQESPGPGAQRMPTPTATPSPLLPGSITPVPASEKYRLDLGAGVVVAFVEGLSLEWPDRVAYVTHVPSGSQAVLDRAGRITDRHDGRGDGPGHLDAVLADAAAMERIMEVLQSGESLRPHQTAADWVPSIRFGGVTYLAYWMLAGSRAAEEERALTVEDLGPELYRVAFRRVGVGASYRYQDGDATYLDPGTPVYGVKGYAPEFRLGTLVGDSVTLFEADTNPLAKIGEDLLDLRGKVTTIDILSEEDATTVLGTLDEEPYIEHFVEMVLGSPVEQGNRDHDGAPYFLGFRLADGTSVVRAFWLESGELSRGIMTDPVVTLFVWSELGKEHRPVASEDGPRISERLAARLGLAYLSFAAPELTVTGKPHSPVVRLMLRSEFEAMRGSAPTMPSDPLVWVVEAQGSWRTGGIVPKEARQDLSVGLVTFDADTGSRYGGRHGNTSLLGTRGDAPLITLTPAPMSTGE